MLFSICYPPNYLIVKYLLTEELKNEIQIYGSINSLDKLNFIIEMQSVPGIIPFWCIDGGQVLKRVDPIPDLNTPY